MLKFITLSTTFLIYQLSFATNIYVNDGVTTGDIYASAAFDGSGDGSVGDPYGTVADAIAASASGDVIYVDAGTYTEDDIRIPEGTSDLTITGAGIDVTIFDGDNTNSGFVIDYSSSASDDIIISKMTIKEMTAENGEEGGGGIRIEQATNITLEEIKFESNNTDAGGTSSGETANWGGGVFVTNSACTVTISKCIFKGNWADDNGGAIATYGTLTINNCLFYDNSCDDDGAAINDWGSTTCNNSTFTENSSGLSGTGYGVVYNASGTTSDYYNCIFYNNTADDNEEGYESSGTLTYTYCIAGGTTALLTHSNRVGNSLTDPLFSDAGSDDFSLQSSSPAVDAGSSTYAPADDINGLARPSGGADDLGCYEADFSIVVGDDITYLFYCEGEGGPSDVDFTTVEGSGLSDDITVTAPSDFQVSDDNVSWAGSVVLSEAGGTVASTKIYARMESGLSTASYSGDITFSSSGVTSKTVSVSGLVNSSDGCVTVDETDFNSGADSWEFFHGVDAGNPVLGTNTLGCITGLDDGTGSGPVTELDGDYVYLEDDAGDDNITYFAKTLDLDARNAQNDDTLIVKFKYNFPDDASGAFRVRLFHDSDGDNILSESGCGSGSSGDYTSADIPVTSGWGKTRVAIPINGADFCDLAATNVSFRFDPDNGSENSGNYISLDNVKVMLVGGPATLLPIELLSKSIECKEGNIQLNWVTSSELNNAYFIIQKKNTEGYYEEIGRVQGNGTTSEIREYTFIDNNITHILNEYELLQVDHDGQMSSEGYLVIDCNYTKRLNLNNVFTDNRILSLQFNQKLNENFQITIYDISGRIIQEQTVFINSNKTSLNSDIDVQGTYIIEVKNENYLFTEKVFFDVK